MRFTGCVLHTEAFDDGDEVVYGSWWDSTILGQCHPFEGHWEDTT